MSRMFDPAIFDAVIFSTAANPAFDAAIFDPSIFETDSAATPVPPSVVFVWDAEPTVFAWPREQTVFAWSADQ